MHLTSDQLETLRKTLSNYGRDSNEKMIALQANKPMPVSTFSLPGDFEPDQDMQERLKRFIVLVQGKMKLIREQGAYGECTKCQTPIPFEKLEYHPWIDRCEDHPRGDDD